MAGPPEGVGTVLSLVVEVSCQLAPSTGFSDMKNYGPIQITNPFLKQRGIGKLCGFGTGIELNPLRIWSIVLKIVFGISEGDTMWKLYECHPEVAQPVFGTITTSGQGDSKTAAIKEDATGRYGTSPLVVWFWVPSIVLVNERRLSVVLSVLSSPATCTLATKRGLDLSIFRADLGDEHLVHILRQRPNAVPEILEEKNLQIGGRPTKTSECKKPLSFTTRVDIVEPEMKASLTSGATPSVNQVSMYSIAIVLFCNSLSRFLSTPRKPNFALHESRYTLKYIFSISLSLEVLMSDSAQIILPLKLVLGDTDSDMFPVIPQGGDLALWNMHRVNLDQYVPFSIANKKALGWVNPHVSLIRSLHFIFGHASGLAEGKPPLCYALQMKDEPEIFVMFYITDLRFDVGSHTMVADAWVMPSSPSVEKFEASSQMIGMGVEEMKAWMHLLVAATERCRTWKHKTNCEYRVQGAIPLTFEPDESPICSCGAGMGTESFVKKYPMLRPLAPCVTRAVISPLFALSYIEKVGNLEDIIASNTPSTPAPAAVGCHREDWKGHKKSRVAPSS
ncbi:hypothetical protein BDR05DRAFT_945303 [Suillus weaverae]|nr:hypothetical protein BDR05DRAFT_945303 [Suillus weaverae]